VPNYPYGVTAVLDNSIVSDAALGSTLPCYVGTAPVNLIKGWTDKGLVNRPVRLDSLDAAARTIGYSGDFDSFTLGHALAAHFDTRFDGVGPIAVINVLDPTLHTGAEVTQTLVFQARQAVIESDLIVLDSLTIDSLAEGVDFTAEWNASRKAVVVTLIGPTATDGSKSATWDTVDPSKVTATAIIGKADRDQGQFEGIGAIHRVGSVLGRPATILATPGWSHIPEVAKALLAVASKADGHWDALVVADLPQTVTTVTAAKAWKTTNGYTSERLVVCWPKVVDANGRETWLSAHRVAATCRADLAHDGIPVRSGGNLSVDTNGLAEDWCLDEIAGNVLDQDGITTTINRLGTWFTWGDQTSAVVDGEVADPRSRFDSTIRLLDYITNWFQARWFDVIDDATDRFLVERIRSTTQDFLNWLVSRGALLGDPTITFLVTDNSKDGLRRGQFVFRLAATTTPPAKALALNAVWTDKGFDTYFGQGDAS